MLKYLTSILLVFLIQECNEKPTSQILEETVITPQTYMDLPKKLDESSGLEVIGEKIYSINDSGGKPELFVFDTKRNDKENIKIENAKNKDWESLAANSTYFFIGDLGNNSGNRENLKIYYFPIKDLNKNKIKADKIKFKYANQTHYNNKSKKHSFDGEAIIALEDTLVIFSKDWLHQTTTAYHVPLDSKEDVVLISPSESIPIEALITGADYDAKNQRLVLCGYKNNHNYIWIFENSTPQRFFSDNYKKLRLDGLFKAQVEGIAFLNENQILISTERTKKFKQQIWMIELNDVVL